MVACGVQGFLQLATQTNVVLRCVENLGHCHEFSARPKLPWKAALRPLSSLRSVLQSLSLDRGATSEGKSGYFGGNDPAWLLVWYP